MFKLVRLTLTGEHEGLNFKERYWMFKDTFDKHKEKDPRLNPNLHTNDMSEYEKEFDICEYTLYFDTDRPVKGELTIEEFTRDELLQLTEDELYQNDILGGRTHDYFFEKYFHPDSEDVKALEMWYAEGWIIQESLKRLAKAKVRIYEES